MLVNKPTFKMDTVTIHEAKAKLSGLITQVEKSGRKIILSRYGKPVAQISPIRPRKRTRIDPKLSKIRIKGDLTADTLDDWDHA